MRTLVEATEARIRQLEQIRAACASTIAAERELLHIQRAIPVNGRSPGALATRRASSNGKGPPARFMASAPPLSSRKQIVKLLEDKYPRDFDPQEVSRKTGVINKSPKGRLSTYSLLARLYQEGKIDKHGPGRYRALAPSKRGQSN
jgi:hypothetical protein